MSKIIYRNSIQNSIDIEKNSNIYELSIEFSYSRKKCAINEIETLIKYLKNLPKILKSLNLNFADNEIGF